MGAVGAKGFDYAKSQVARLNEAVAKSGTKVLPTPTAIIDAAVAAIAAIDLANGVGPPDSGAAFSAGSQKFENVVLQLSAAMPEPQGWEGDSAKAYADANAAQQALAKTMQELDKQAQALVERQSKAVQSAHRTIALTSLGLAVAKGIALSLYLIPGSGPEISAGWQSAAALAAAITVLERELFAYAESLDIEIETVGLSENYRAVAAQAGPSGTFARFATTGAAETWVGSAAAVSRTSVFSEMPTVGTLASLAGDNVGAQQRAFHSDSTENDLPADGALEVPETPGLPSEPVLTVPRLPTVADVSAMSAQAARMSGQVSQHMNLVNQTMGQVQQVAAMARGHGSAAPPAEEAAVEEAANADTALAAPAENAGVASGVASAERAPIDITTAGASDAREPKFGERIL
ncbi:hypothetical protein F0Q45_02445 [Mycobacterium simiae]|uniref:ESX-1 secretion-associated protein EspA/EspE-like domain-containing protein n=1 Tax=Mycobacterium simiae TaxID=1784 RepID=A0A5B1BSD2_MYCSI|nr:EspA/EspE family type VII secretion system effector [Mycobacterium simiae]KAA1251748.1 hypothetical protein F0Q45_02445 [Mycobacterium simiae]